MVKRICFALISFVALVTLVLFDTSCGPTEKDSENKDTVAGEQNKPFAVADYNFAIQENNEFKPYNKAIYQRGDEVFLTLENVGPFKLGPDSLNHAEMKLKVTDVIGQVIVLRDSIFGQRGHGRFKNNMLKKPYGSYTSMPDDKPGKYTICITIFDLVKGDSIVVCDDFVLE